jgi:hypothetical protein
MSEGIITQLDTPTYTCMGNVKCTTCGKRHGYCDEVSAQLTGAVDGSGRYTPYLDAGKPFKTWWNEETTTQLTGAVDGSGRWNKETTMVDLGAHYDKEAKTGGGKLKRRPFLKSADIPIKGTQAKITDFRVAPKQMEYSDFLCELTIGKKEFTWGLRSKSVTLNMLVDKLGKNTDKWIGKTIKLVKAGPKGQYINLGE